MRSRASRSLHLNPAQDQESGGAAGRAGEGQHHHGRCLRDQEQRHQALGTEVLSDRSGRELDQGLHHCEGRKGGRQQAQLPVLFLSEPDQVENEPGAVKRARQDGGEREQAPVAPQCRTSRNLMTIICKSSFGVRP
jgi:hypothetical protein